MRILFLLSLLLLITHNHIANAADTPQMPAPIKALADDGAQIRFIGSDLGLNGWLAIKNGQEQYFYVTPDGQAIVSGVLFNSKGDTITIRQINDLRGKEGAAIDKLAGFVETPEVKKPAPEKTGKSKGEQLYAGAEAANFIKIGSDTAPPYYVFIDPECPHCHDLIQDFRKSGFIEKNMVQLRLIPVGVLSANSMSEAALLLASPTPEADLFKHLDGHKDALRHATVAPLNTQGVERNMKLMQDWNLDVTPFSVYKTMNGQVKIIQGRANNLKEIIAELR